MQKVLGRLQAHVLRRSVTAPTVAFALRQESSAAAAAPATKLAATSKGNPSKSQDKQ